MRKVYACDRGVMCRECPGKDKCTNFIVMNDAYDEQEDINKGSRALYGNEDDTLRK